MSDSLISLLGCGLPWAEQRAETALQIAQANQRGEIAADEARALLEDLALTDQLNQEATDAEVRGQLVFGITTVIRMLV